MSWRNYHQHGPTSLRWRPQHSSLRRSLFWYLPKNISRFKDENYQNWIKLVSHSCRKSTIPYQFAFKGTFHRSVRNQRRRNSSGLPHSNSSLSEHSLEVQLIRNLKKQWINSSEVSANLKRRKRSRKTSSKCKR